ncbi:hypothetical protein [Phormidesmis priestleyi]
MPPRLKFVGLAIATLLFCGAPTLLPRADWLLPTLAQTTTDRKAEADRLLDQGVQQYRTSQYEAALQSWEQALAIYRIIQDRNGEATALNNLGEAHRLLS